MNIETGEVRWIALDGAVNARVVAPGVLLRSDNLQSLTARDVRLLVEQETVITEDSRQQAEWLVRGRHPLAIGTASAPRFPPTVVAAPSPGTWIPPHPSDI